jgi:ATP-dependent helicase/nuclease subunit A
MSLTPRLPFDEPEAAAAESPVGAAFRRPDHPTLSDAGDRAAAVDPTLNVVLEASAGTGKTGVLVSRYVNLLKSGVDPAHILAITFTRKAAAEMRERILATVHRAAVVGEIDPRRWRELRARLGDVGISTIDAFCLSLLREFPLEADLDPGFRMADETEMVRLVDETLDGAVRTCRTIAKSDGAVELVIAQLGDAPLRAGLADLLDRRLVAGPALRRFLARAAVDSPQSLCVRTAERLRDVLLGVDGGLDQFVADGPIDHPRYAVFARDVRNLTAAGVGHPHGAKWTRQLRAVAEELREHFLTKDGAPRTRWTRYKTTHAVSEQAWRRHRDRVAQLAPAISEELTRFRRDLNVVLARGVWRIFAVTLDAYHRTLEAHGVLDFPEALWKALELLRQMDEFAQSRFLLESRYHHLLVDEFQDTSQAQWELVWRLVEAWGAGLGAADASPLEPSIFIVGDRKQSIYGFRDADPSVLERAASSIAGLRMGKPVRRAIRHSFRAVPPLLSFVNDLFAGVDKVVGRSDAFAFAEHDRFPLEVEGGVSAEPVVGILTGRDHVAAAALVAEEIANLIGRSVVRDKRTGLARVATPGDVAILFRSREGHTAFESELESRGINTYVYKGLGFFDADEIQDVFAVLRYLAEPSSNLRAAALMRSRLVRLSDAALQRLAPHLALALRAPVSAEESLEARDRAVLRQTRQAFAQWLPLVDRVPPAELLDRILRESAYSSELAGPRARQARENLKKVRSVIRRIQNRGYATMARVASHLDRLSAGDESNAVIDAADAVNLMTVHAAKGLEFPIVFIVNLGKGAGGGRSPIRVHEDVRSGGVAVSVGDYASEADEDLVLREREETKRLLYVATTRARDRLYLSAAFDGERFRPARGSLGEVLPASMIDLISGARAGAQQIADWNGASRRHRIRMRSAG